MAERTRKAMGWTRAAWTAPAVLLALFACRLDRQYESPYLPGSPDYAGDDWTRDADGNGIADSVEKYLPDCKLPPKQCLENAKILGAIPADRYALAARNLLLWMGDSARAPDLEWSPADAALRGYGLSSSDSSIVRVRNGKLLAAAAGSAQIDVVVPGLKLLSTSFIATVASQGKRVDSVGVSDIEVAVGRDTVPHASWYPADATYKDYSLVSDQPAVASVVGQSVRGVSVGTTRMVLYARDGGRTASFTVKVIDHAKALALSVDPMFLVRGGNGAAPHLVWTPADIADQGYRLATVETTSVVELSADSLQVIPKLPGVAQMLALSADGRLTAEFSVTVAARSIPVTGISAQDMNLPLGRDPQPPLLTWSPSDASDREYDLTTSDSGVAVPSGGLISPVGMGTADFTVTTQDGGFSAAFKVTVGRPDSSLHVDSVRVAAFSLPVGETRRVSPTWFPPNAGNLSFSLSTPDTAMVAITGESVRGVKAGTANLTLTSADGGHTADFKVAVYAPYVPVQQVTVDTLSIYVGANGVPAIRWTPANATDLGYTLVSLDSNIASILTTGSVPVVHGKSVGATSVTLRPNSGPSTVFPVTVNAVPVRVNGISVPNFQVILGDAPVLPNITFYPTNATDKRYVVSAPQAGGVISVSENKVSGLKSGKAPLTVTPTDNTSAAVICTVTVVAKVRSVSAKDDTLRIGAGDKSVAGNLTWDPPDANDKSFSLKSNDTTLVKIAASGTAYHGVAGGKTSVIVRALDGSGKADTFAVTVQVPVTQVIAGDVSMKTTDTSWYNPYSLFNWLPSNASNKNWSLAYTNPGATPAPSSIVSIMNGWALKELAPGSARITVISLDNPAVKDTFTVTVIRPVSSLTATLANVNMKVGGADTAAPISVNPSDASDKAFTLASGNTSVATVAGGNKLHAVGGGTATFTAKSVYDTTKTATFTVTVTIPVASVSASDLSLRIGEGDKDPILAWTPANATNKSYTLASTNTALLTIVSNKLHGVAPGTANATVTSGDGGKTATFAVTLVQPVVSVSAANLAMRRGDADRDPVITWNPGNASNKGYTLSGGSSGIATVVANRVHAVGAGSVVLTVTSADDGKTGTFTVTVTNPVTGIDGGADISFRFGDPDYQVPVSISPSDASNKNWHMVSEDPTIASVNGSSIHPVSRGDVNVFIISDDNAAITDTVGVSVKGFFGP
ncbi:MAG: hypothetical protein JF616_07760 [Fibrobacteres bacterium]|nr:hypothetical protein [Fibrobacterota bacterium]